MKTRTLLLSVMLAAGLTITAGCEKPDPPVVPVDTVEEPQEEPQINPLTGHKFQHILDTVAMGFDCHLESTFDFVTDSTGYFIDVINWTGILDDEATYDVTYTFLFESLNVIVSIDGGEEFVMTYNPDDETIVMSEGDIYYKIAK